MRERFRPVDLMMPHEQKYDSTCGAAALMIALNSLPAKHHYTEERIIREMESGMTGVEWYEMVNYITDEVRYPVLYRTRSSYQELLDEYNQFGYPIIVCWQTDRSRKFEGCALAGEFKAEPGGHFSVIKHIDEDNIWVCDPGVGDIFKMARQDFSERWYEEGSEKCFMAIRPR